MRSLPRGCVFGVFICLIKNMLERLDPFHFPLSIVVFQNPTWLDATLSSSSSIFIFLYFFHYNLHFFPDLIILALHHSNTVLNYTCHKFKFELLYENCQILDSNLLKIASVIWLVIKILGPRCFLCWKWIFLCL